MKWPWRFRRVIPPPPQVEDTREEAREALETEHKRAEQIEKQEEVVNVLGRQIRRIRAENNYYHMVKKVFEP